MIVRDWNVKYNDDYCGYVMCFDVKVEVVNNYECWVVGGCECEELWILVDEFLDFNVVIIGNIKVVVKFEC